MAATQTAFTSVEIITLVAGSSVLAAVVTQGVSWLRNHIQSKSNRAFAKVYLVAALEGYAAEASNAISDSENYETSDGQIGRPVGNIPMLDTFPDTIDWRSLGPKTTKQMLSFQVDLENIRASFAFDWDVVGDEDHIVPRVREKTALVGLKALQLARSLQAQDEGANIDLSNPDWSVKSALEADLEKYEKRRVTSEARQKAMIEKLGQHVSAGGDVPKSDA